MWTRRSSKGGGVRPGADSWKNPGTLKSHPEFVASVALAGVGVRWAASRPAIPLPGIQTKTGIEVLFTSCPGLTDVSDEVALCVYRIAQEALNNIGRHSGAKKAVVELTRGPKEIQLTIRDFGKGFNTERSRKRGLGLISMSERARLLHGAVEIGSQIGSGTQVSLKIPFVRRKPVRVGRAVGQGAG